MKSANRFLTTALPLSLVTMLAAGCVSERTLQRQLEREVRQQVAREVATRVDSPLLERALRHEQGFSEHRHLIEFLQRDIERQQLDVVGLVRAAAPLWGQHNVREPTPLQLVRYLDDFRARGMVDFDAGQVQVETVGEAGFRRRLREAIVATLLTPGDGSAADLFGSTRFEQTGAVPLLAGQVRDQDGVLVRWEWRAGRYADWLIDNRLIIDRTPDGRPVYRVDIPLEEGNREVRGLQYEALVRRASRQYGISESLIYSIIEVESSFNPYAVSPASAYGLMQVVPSTAGRDVYQRVKRRPGQPTRERLFQPDYNIDIGTAYLTILRDVYLVDIRDPRSRELAMISAYNGGAGSVLRTFHSNRSEAIRQINQLTPEQLYQRLNRDHPFAETRHYIYKVMQARQRYDARAVALSEFDGLESHN